MRLNRHFHTFELLRTPPHKPQKSIQNDHETVRFCNGLGRHPNLRISRYLERLAGWSPKKPEVDDISVHFGILTDQVPQRLGCVPSVLVCNRANSVGHGYTRRPIIRLPKLFHFPAEKSCELAMDARSTW